MLVMLFDMIDEKSDTELLEIGIRLKKNSMNNGQKAEEIAPLPIEIFSQLMSSIIRVFIKDMCLPETFNALHKRIFGEEIPQNVLGEIFNQLQEDCKLGDKYTIQNYSWCYREALKKFGYIIENGDGILELINGTARR